VRFVVAPAGERIWADWSRDSAVKRTRDMTALLVGPILGTVLRMRGAVSLHACVLDVASRAVAVAAGAGTGKSTLAAEMAQRGHAIVSDDVGAVVRDAPREWTAHPGYPRLRLNPDSLRALHAGANPGGAVLTREPKRYLNLSEGPKGTPWRFHAEPLTLRAVYVLERDRGVKIPAVEHLDPQSRVAALLQQVRPSPFPLPPETRAAELERLADLAGDVEVRRLRCPDGLDSLRATCDALVRDVEAGLR
jgi:hypothetical protein